MSGIASVTGNPLPKVVCKHLFVLLTTPLCLLTSACSHAEDEQIPHLDRPNVLLIVADDMGFTDLGSFGSEIPTPNLDDLAERGLRLTNFHAAPVCAPTRAMLMSGMDNHEAGMASMDIKRAFDNGRPPPVHVTGYGERGYEGYLSPFLVAMPEAFQAAGYRTYMVGKWDLGRALVEEHNPAGRGFDRSFSQLTGTAIHLPDSTLVAHGGVKRADPLVFRRDWEVVETLPADYFSSNAFADQLIAYLDEDSDEPFFAYLSFTAPHFPLQAPDEWVSRFTGKYDEGYEVFRERRIKAAASKGVINSELATVEQVSEAPSWSSLGVQERKSLARKMEVYAAMIANMDHNVGRVVARLRGQGRLENTLVFFMSDNGAAPDFPPKYADGYDNRFENLGKADSFMSYGRGWAEVSTGPFRDVKGSLAEGGTRASAILVPAGGPRVAGISNSYTTVQDVMPTLLELAGVEHPGKVHDDRPVLPMRGRSMAGLVTDPDTLVHAPEAAIGWEFEGQRALVQGPYKILWGGDDWMLFDLEDDPGERTDMAEACPDLVKILNREWQEYADAVGVVR